MQVLLVAIPRKSADALLKMLLQAKLKPHIVGIKPLALTRLVKETTAIIVDVQPTEFDIVIMVDGVPHPIRTVYFPHEALSWQEKSAVIRSELDRTIKFYDSNNQERPLLPSTPIFVSGEPVHKPELSLFLPNEPGHSVSLLSSPLECREQLDLSRYMVNIGLALQQPSLGKMAGPSLANLNLLPNTYQPKPISWAKVVALPSALAIIGLMVPLIMLVQSASVNTASTWDQVTLSSQVLREKQLQKQELRNNIAQLDKELAEVEASHHAFTRALDSLDRQGTRVNRDLEVATNILPSTISLNSISYASGRLTLSGRAPSEAELLSYARSLGDSGRFSEIITASMKKTEDEGMNFTLVLKREVE